MLLSVAMIVKDEEKYIEKVLKALKKVKNRISCEIIIVDTGSKDNTVNICKKYTNKVYFHKWNNNFGEMRNISIKHCKGQWILILDGDEVIENPEELINFFEEGMYNKGNSACVNFKNLINDNNYALAPAFRLFRRDNDFGYEGRVHEQVKMKSPYLKTNINVIHYGYLSQDYKLMMYKFERNYELLEKDLKENPNDIYKLFQMSQTLSMAQKRKEALVYIEKAYDIVCKRKDCEKYVYIYHCYARELLNLHKYDKCIEVCNKAIDMGKNFLDFYCFLTIAYFNLNKDEKVLFNGNKYLQIHKDYYDSEQAKDFSTVNVSYAKKDEIVKFIVASNYKINNYKGCINFYECIENNMYKTEVKQQFIYSCLIEERIDKLKKAYKKDEFQDYDIELIIDILENLDLDKEKKKKLYLGLRNINKNLDIFIKFKYEKKEKENFIIDFNEYYNWKLIMLEYLIKNNYINLNILIDLQEKDIYMYIKELTSKYDYIECLIKYCKNNFLTQDLKILKFISIIEEALIKSNFVQEEDLKQTIYRNIINKNILINKIYNKNILETSIDIISATKDKFYYKIINCIRKSSIDLIESLKELKDAVRYKEISKCIIDTIKEDLSQDIITDKMKDEKSNLLKIVEDLVNQNNLTEAEEILLELNNMFNYDNKILNSLGVINYIKENYDKSLQYIGIAYLLSDKDFECVFNIATVLENINRIEDSKKYYSEALNLCEDNNIKEYIITKLK